MELADLRSHLQRYHAMLEALRGRIGEQESQPGMAALGAFLDGRLAVNYGCSNGNCGLCKARVVSGQVMKVRPHDYVLSETEKSQGYTLLAGPGGFVVSAAKTLDQQGFPAAQLAAMAT